MRKLILQRLIRAVPVLLIASFVVLVLVEMSPGNLAVTLLGENATAEQIESVNKSMGLDQPLLQRWVASLGDMVRLDFGESLITGQPVVDLLKQRLPVTIELAVLAQLLALLIAVPAALVSASRPQKGFDRCSTAVSSALISAPHFLIAMVLVYFVAVKARWLPVTGWVGLTDSVTGNLRYAALPVLVLALDTGAVYMRLLRSDLIATLQEDYILAARAKRLPTRYILFRHALRPSSFSLVTVFGLYFGRLIGGTVVIETIFALPGLGRLLVQSIISKDYAVVQGITIFIALCYVGVNLLVDLAYAYLDPRVGAGLRSQRQRRARLSVAGG